MYPAMGEGRIKDRLGGGRAKHGEDIGQAVVGAISRAQFYAQQGFDGMGTGSSPVTNGNETMGAFAEDVGQPDSDERAHAGPLPMAVRTHMGVNQRANAQVLDQPKQEGDAVDLFIGQGGRVTIW